MNRGRSVSIVGVRGYTIVEVLIFLATSTALFTMCMLLISGQQGKAQFVTTVRDMESTLNDIANNVATGYYTRNADFRCQVTGAGIVQIRPPGSVEQGENIDCIYAGTVVKFGETTSRDTYIQIPMAGKRQLAGKDVTSLIEARPRTIYETSPTPVTGLITRSRMPFGAQVACMRINSAPACNPIGNSAIGFFTTFNGADPGARKGGIQSDLLYFNIGFGTTLTSTTNTINSTFNTLTDIQLAAMRVQTAEICITSASSNQYALLTLGGAASNQTVSSEIKNISASQPVCS